MNAIWDISSKAGLNLGTVGLIEQVGHLTAWLMDWPKSRSAEAVPQQASCRNSDCRRNGARRTWLWKVSTKRGCAGGNILGTSRRRRAEAAGVHILVARLRVAISGIG